MVKLNITTHSGDDDIVEVEEYSAVEIAKQVNDHDIHAIAIGDIVYSRIDVKNIKPVYEAE
ncbi:hypothetical protein [Gracilibacillus alcaliphilus]|uniref:hypothetical protein n=1 Tax=Gracilibacillus alcaliphilus TaxID=1401441 RepID=UPI0019571B6F|nr:hypothetical protein [Gracilibacillus alcaliphilus]MBM7678370.1 hypothetical protein [Gracilibacillus alcaliphilus]